jgi:hypothetical protein
MISGINTGHNLQVAVTPNHRFLINEQPQDKTSIQMVPAGAQNLTSLEFSLERIEHREIRCRMYQCCQKIGGSTKKLKVHGYSFHNPIQKSPSGRCVAPTNHN